MKSDEQLKALNQAREDAARQRSEPVPQQYQRSEEALHPQIKVLPSILNSIEDGVIIIDTKGSVLFFNSESERLLRTTLTGSKIEECFQQYETYLPDMLTAYPAGEELLQRAIRGEAVHGTEMFLRHPKVPEGIWLSISSQPLTDPQRLVRGAVIVMTDITSRKLLEKQIAEISEREQRRIGQDLHDGLCQELVSATLTCAMLREQFKGSPEARLVEELSSVLDECITQARNLAGTFYPVRLEVDGLAAALDELASTVERRSGIACQFTCERPVVIHDPVAAVTLYRIAQEAVNNAVKHSRAKNISLGLEAVEDEVTLTVSDNGIGFVPALRDHRRMGLHMMRYRARVIGASLDIRRGPNGGTMVSCFFHNVEPSNYERPPN